MNYNGLVTGKEAGRSMERIRIAKDFLSAFNPAGAQACDPSNGYRKMITPAS
jgi:hypothetical protein